MGEYFVKSVGTLLKAMSPGLLIISPVHLHIQ